MFLPVATARLFLDVWLLSEQSSNAGSGSLMTVPTPFLSGAATTYESLTFSCVTGLTAYAPWVTDGTFHLIGALLALMCIVTVYCTANIYSSLKPIRAWHNRFVTPAYLLLALHTGLLCTWALSSLPYALVQLDASRLREIDTMLIENPRRHFEGTAARFAARR